MAALAEGSLGRRGAATSLLDQSEPHGSSIAKATTYTCFRPVQQALFTRVPEPRDTSTHLASASASHRGTVASLLDVFCVASTLHPSAAAAATSAGRMLSAGRILHPSTDGGPPATRVCLVYSTLQVQRAIAGKNSCDKNCTPSTHSGPSLTSQPCDQKLHHRTRPPQPNKPSCPHDHRRLHRTGRARTPAPSSGPGSASCC